jgi:hypothetical protein
MAELTPAQRAAAEALIAGSHFKVDPSYQPATVGPDVTYPQQGSELNTRRVQTVAINPLTGMPVMVARDGTRTPAVTQQQQQAIRDPMGTQNVKAGAPAPRLPANVADGSVNPRGGQVRLDSSEYDFALGPKPKLAPALAAIDDATTPPVMFALRGGGALKGYAKPNYGEYAARFRAAPMLAPARKRDPLFDIVYKNPNRGFDPWAGMRGPGEGRQPVMRAPAPPPVLPSYATTDFQQDRFQTTSGAQMPGSMNSSRWLTGY